MGLHRTPPRRPSTLLSQSIFVMLNVVDAKGEKSTECQTIMVRDILI
jgi:hypothetical protein